MLFWMNRLFSQGMEQFSVSWFDGMDDQSQIVHELLERTYSSSTQTYWSTTRAALMPFHPRVIALPLHEFTGTRRNIKFLMWPYGWTTTIHLLFDRGPSCSTRQGRVFSTPGELVWTPGSHKIISHFSLVDLLWFDSDFVFYGDFLFYGIVSSLIDYFIFDVFLKSFLNKTPGRFTTLDFEIKLFWEILFSRLVVIPSTPKVVKPRVCSIGSYYSLFNSHLASQTLSSTVYRILCH